MYTQRITGDNVKRGQTITHDVAGLKLGGIGGVEWLEVVSAQWRNYDMKILIVRPVGDVAGAEYRVSLDRRTVVARLRGMSEAALVTA